MNREIKFKAKRLDNQEWVCGYFYEENDNTYIIENRQKESKLNRNITYQVDPNTVCQFTGRVDKDGKELYENDIIDFRTIMDVPLTGKIVWSDASSLFELLNSNGHKMRELWKALDIKRKGSAVDKEDNHE